MVYDFGTLTENNYTGVCDSTRSLDSSDAEFEIEERPVLEKKKRFDGMSTSLRGRPRSTSRDVLSLSLRDRPRSTSATRRISAAIAKMTEKDKKDVTLGDVRLELMDDEDEQVDLRESGSNCVRVKSSNKIAELVDIPKVSMKRQNSVQRNSENESNSTNRPQVLRAPSFMNIDTPSDDIPGSAAEKTISEQARDKSPATSKRIWAHRPGRRSDDSVPNVLDVPSSPSLRRSPPRSPRRLWTKDTVGADSKISPLDNLANESNILPASPAREVPRCSSPIKAFSQRAMSSILRNRKKAVDDNSDLKLEVAEGLNTNISNSNHAPPSSPTKRAIAGILRACSLHDRSSPVKSVSAHERTKVFSIHTNNSSKISQGEQVVQCEDKEETSEKFNQVELSQGATVISSNSERGTRSSAHLIVNDNSSYSRAVNSLVSPRQVTKRRLRASTGRESEKVLKNRVARPRTRSENGATGTAPRTRSSSIGGTSLSSSSHKQIRRLSNGNSVSSKRDESSQCSKMTSGGRVRSQSRPRRLSSRSSSGGTKSLSNDDNSTIKRHGETVSRRSSSRRNLASANVELPRTPRSSRSGKTDVRKSASRTGSRRNVSEIQIPFVDDPDPQQPIESGLQSDSDKGVLHHPKTPELRRLKGRDEATESVKRSGSRRRISDVPAPSIEGPKTPRSIRSGDRISSHSRRSRSVCPVSPSNERAKHISRGNSIRIVSVSQSKDPTSEEEKSVPCDVAFEKAKGQRSSNRAQSHLECSTVTAKAPIRSRVEEGDDSPSSVVEQRLSSKPNSKSIISESETIKKKRTDSASRLKKVACRGHAESN